MAIREKVSKKPSVEKKKIDQFISKGSKEPEDQQKQEDHRLSLKIPKWLLREIDRKRRERVGNFSRTLWIVEQLEKAVKRRK